MTAAEEKAMSTLAAKAACRGLIAVQTTTGNIVLSRFGGAWIFASVPVAAAWLDAIDLKVPA